MESKVKKEPSAFSNPILPKLLTREAWILENILNIGPMSVSQARDP